MVYIGHIGSGFKLIHRNWQLVLVQVVMMIIAVVGLFVIVGIPAVAVFVAVGLDVAELSELDEVLDTVDDPMEVLSKYLGLIIVVVISFFIYITLGFLMWVYVMGGSVGIIGKAIREPTGGFNMEAFFMEANRLFLPMAGYTTVIGLTIIGTVILLGMLGAAAAVLLGAIAPESAIGTFLKVLTVLVFATGGVIVVFGMMVAFALGTGALALEGRGSMESLDVGFKHLWKHPGALWLVGLLILGYIVIQFPLVLIGIGAELVGGAFLSLPFQLAMNVFQSYLSLVMLAVVLVYYRATSDTTSESSTQAVDISVGEVPPQGPLPPGMEATQ
jgi:hypothetical protein